MKPFGSAVAGAKKKIMAVSIMRAALRKRQCSTNLNRTIAVLLTPSREQRDEALVSLRKLIQNPIKIAALSRPAHEKKHKKQPT